MKPWHIALICFFGALTICLVIGLPLGLTRSVKNVDMKCLITKECVSGFSVAGRCSTGDHDAVCIHHHECLSGVCQMLTHRCSDKTDGNSCMINKDCISGKCLPLMNIFHGKCV